MLRVIIVTQYHWLWSFIKQNDAIGYDVHAYTYIDDPWTFLCISLSLAVNKILHATYTIWVSPHTVLDNARWNLYLLMAIWWNVCIWQIAENFHSMFVIVTEPNVHQFTLHGAGTMAECIMVRGAQLCLPVTCTCCIYPWQLYPWGMGPWSGTF